MAALEFDLCKVAHGIGLRAAFVARRPREKEEEEGEHGIRDDGEQPDCFEAVGTHSGQKRMINLALARRCAGIERYMIDRAMGLQTTYIPYASWAYK